MKIIKSCIDSGASKSIISKECAKRLIIKCRDKPQRWSTIEGIVETNTKAKANFSLP